MSTKQLCAFGTEGEVTKAHALYTRFFPVLSKGDFELLEFLWCQSGLWR